MSPHPFDSAIALTREPPDRWLGRTSADYWNMVSPYGGVTAGAMLQAMLDHPERRGTPLAFTLNFLAPIAAGE
ncbi:MAG: thioesterase family protein, partial [Rhodocyclales bacterium]|nr:thioesterase family protein [Rhodocyclales bacterium]